MYAEGYDILLDAIDKLLNRRVDKGNNSVTACFNMAAETGDGRVQKMEVDYSSTVDEKLPKCEKLAKVKALYFNSLCFIVLEIIFGYQIMPSVYRPLNGFVVN